MWKRNKAEVKMVRKVIIKNGNGYKSVSIYRRGKHLGTAKKYIHVDHIDIINNGKFIPCLFKDCVKTCKNRK